MPWHLYIIDLSAEVWGVPTFRAKNRRAAARHDQGILVRAVYIGSGNHRGPCRFAIYQGSRECTCGLMVEGRVRHGMASPWAESFGVRVAEERVVTGNNAVLAARALGSELRRAGVGVWQVP